MAMFLVETVARQKKAAADRERLEAEGVRVPPIMIASVTNRCNLSCKGCYNRAQHRPVGLEMAAADWSRVFREARDLGISIVLLAGGEPLVRPDVLDAAAAVPEILFPVFTNGLLLDDAFVSRLSARRNLIPVLSIEGHEDETDERRGEGVYQRLRETMAMLRSAGGFFGVSLTVTSQNFEDITGEGFVRECISAGCRLFFYREGDAAQGCAALPIAADNPARRRQAGAHQGRLRALGEPRLGQVASRARRLRQVSSPPKSKFLPARTKRRGGNLP